MSIVIGLIMMAAGGVMVWKTETFLSMFGRMEFFDKYLGTEGGSRLGYKLIGMIAVFLGVLAVTGLINGFMLWLLSPLLQFSQTK